MDHPSAKPIIAALLEPLQPLTRERNDLADERVVELLVRGYVDRALAAFQEALKGNVTQDTAIEAINAQATALNAVFLGTSGFDTVIAHPWNAADQLGEFLRDTLDLQYPADDAVRAALIHLATQIMTAVRGEESVWKDQVNTLARQWTELLVGRLPEGW